MDLAALRALIDSDAANAARTDAQVRDLFMYEVITVQTDISLKDFTRWVNNRDVASKMRAVLADVGATDAEKTSAEIILTWLTWPDGIPLSHNEIRAVLDDVTGPSKALQNPARQALLDMSDQTMPRWQVEGYRLLDDASWLYWIAQARAL